MKKQSLNLGKIVNALTVGDYQDGTTIGEKLKITRSAVWKTIERLKEYGVKIDAVKGKGYALHEPLVLLNQRKIKAFMQQRLSDTANDFSLQIFESLSSTNDYLRLVTAKKSLLVCLAEQQTKGKGRLGRAWHSPFGLNLYLSCLYHFDKDVSELAGLSLVAGLVVAKTLNEFAVLGKKASVKWPNDVLVDGAKIAGTLIEVQAETHGACYAVIGIGVNVNMLQDAIEISQPFTSLREMTGAIVDRNEVCARLLLHLRAALELFNREGLAPFMQEWAALDCLQGKKVTLERALALVSGVVQGVNEQGHLLLQPDAGGILAFSSGDVKLFRKS